ncbi:bifunctional 4-hydroxy-2-oxoglutarate aldolase/2-dehydro-3-deoxy-phosphogluconate aldolase [Nonomuraea jiangxiensis]|uniref:2-dehydro-3-deoxy-phosphogluconate aldolase n=1 Tax=Nonomuraea jiangxiensis TaxID=633440 RepID=A0A1G8WDX4_9ACTN|nr:bifunctional 4-hydroxy-2-oxoglutarate aldolase/2-dehydro-3-deoxy-phosphogluconate aldolase [Nonomuraea jiangxiensis]SDJ76403.1 2-dehydro-3-deoxyphosphogluconate aldolase / (4S)-4-hydroxy-2-oxoglutarate aldolase [Nonomuraea jiangxiensis]
MSLLDLAPVIPVVVIEDVESAVPMARALVAGGLPVIEVTLRTPVAREAIARIAAEVPEANVGAGTVRTSEDIAEAVSAGARFLVSPGTTLALVEALDSSGVPYLPGAGTVSEIMALAERGVKELKFFPAEAAGGIPYLKSLQGPLPDVRFCPTGGIRAETAPGYLALANVGCVGGSWLTPADALAAGDWSRVEKLASEAAALR